MNTSISLFFGLIMLQTFGAGCTALVEVGDDSGDDEEAGPDGVTGGDESSASSGGVGGSSSTGGGGGWSAGAGGPSAAEGSSSVGVGGSGSTGGGDSSSVGVGGSGSTGGGPDPATASAIALFGSQLPDPSGDPGSSSSAGGGPSPEPNDLYVLIGEAAQSCADPQAALGCGSWRAEFIIPPASQVPGIYTLNGRYLTSSFYESGPDRGDGTCWMAGGTFGPGTLEIVSIDATEVVIRLSDTPTGEFDANGEHTAVRCP